MDLRQLITLSRGKMAKLNSPIAISNFSTDIRKCVLISNMINEINEACANEVNLSYAKISDDYYKIDHLINVAHSITNLQNMNKGILSSRNNNTNHDDISNNNNNYKNNQKHFDDLESIHLNPSLISSDSQAIECSLRNEDFTDMTNELLNDIYDFDRHADLCYKEESINNNNNDIDGATSSLLLNVNKSNELDKNSHDNDIEIDVECNDNNDNNASFNDFSYYSQNDDPLLCDKIINTSEIADNNENPCILPNNTSNIKSTTTTDVTEQISESDEDSGSECQSNQASNQPSMSTTVSVINNSNNNFDNLSAPNSVHFSQYNNLTGSNENQEIINSTADPNFDSLLDELATSLENNYCTLDQNNCLNESSYIYDDKNEILTSHKNSNNNNNGNEITSGQNNKSFNSISRKRKSPSDTDNNPTNPNTLSNLNFPVCLQSSSSDLGSSVDSSPESKNGQSGQNSFPNNLEGFSNSNLNVNLNECRNSDNRIGSDRLLDDYSISPSKVRRRIDKNEEYN